MLDKAQREEIVRIAETWIGTPFRGHSCVKGAGVDCGQLLRGVFTEAGYLPPDAQMPKDYSLQISQHRHDTEYIDTVRKYMREITEEEVLPGDVVIYKLGMDVFAHSGIIKSWPSYIIHAVEEQGVCGGHGMNFRMGRLKKKFFTLREEYL